MILFIHYAYKWDFPWKLFSSFIYLILVIYQILVFWKWMALRSLDLTSLIMPIGSKIKIKWTHFWKCRKFFGVGPAPDAQSRHGGGVSQSKGNAYNIHSFQYNISISFWIITNARIDIQLILMSCFHIFRINFIHNLCENAFKNFSLNRGLLCSRTVDFKSQICFYKI